MKTELTKELKEKFVTQYWGQKVAIYKSDTAIKLVVGHHSVNINDIDKVVLKSLYAITDEDAIEVARLLYGDSNDFEIEFNSAGITSVSPFGLPCYGPTVNIHWNGVLNYERANSEDYYFAYQYLQSKGYALPWMGYSVEELVEAGWVKLTPNN